MTTYNVVRFRTKPGKEQAFIDAPRRRRSTSGASAKRRSSGPATEPSASSVNGAMAPLLQGIARSSFRGTCGREQPCAASRILIFELRENRR